MNQSIGLKSYSRLFAVLTAIIILGVSIPTIVSANSAEPPGFTIIVSNAPEDLTLSLLYKGESQPKELELQKAQKAWETYFVFYYMQPDKNYELENTVLIVQSSEYNFDCTLPADTFKKYNNLLTLDLKSESLKIGQSPFRVPILIALRVVLTLLIEGAVFFLFGYRNRRSWIAFAVINILTQGVLNALITGPNIGPYWMMGFIVIEILILIVELVAFINIVKEHRKIRTAVYVITANLASLILGGLLISYLPV